MDRAHREFTDEQVEYVSNIVRLFRNESLENRHGGGEALRLSFPDGKYEDLPGLCKAATLKEIESQGWSLNPGRYVSVAAQEQEEFDFKTRLTELNAELGRLNGEAAKLEVMIDKSVTALLVGP